MPWLAKVRSDSEIAAWIKNVVLRQEIVRTAVSQDVHIGFCAFRDGWLNHLYVVPDQRGKGVGTALFSEACHGMQEGFRFYVFQRNRDARRFYEARGCRLVKLGDGSCNEEREPDALYEWRSPPNESAATSQ